MKASKPKTTTKPALPRNSGGGAQPTAQPYRPGAAGLAQQVCGQLIAHYTGPGRVR